MVCGNGAQIQIAVNQGHLDQLVNATPLLISRCNAIREYRMKRGFTNPYPTIADIEKTHFVAVNDTFKPVAAIALEYQEYKPTGSSALGELVEIEIKDSGDFFSDMGLEVVIPAVQCGSAALPDIVVNPSGQLLTPANQPLNGGNAVNFGTGADAGAGDVVNVDEGAVYDFTGGALATQAVLVNGVAYNLYTAAAATAALGAPALGSIQYLYTDHCGNFIAGPNGTDAFPTNDGFGGAGGTAVLASNYVRLAEFPGARLCEHTRFMIDRKTIDEYSDLTIVEFRSRCCMQGWKREGFDRCIGQEVPLHARADSNCAWEGQASMCDLTGSVAYSDLREQCQALGGAQTPKVIQPELRVIIPLLFWFCLSKRSALCGICIPDGDKVVQVRYAPLANLYYAAPGDLFIQERIVYYPAVPAATSPIITTLRRIPYIVPGSSPEYVSSQNVITSLIVCNLFVEDCVHDIYVHKIGFNLCRLHLEQRRVLQADSDEVLLNQIKWPVEYLFFKFIANANTDASNTYLYEDWHRCNLSQRSICPTTCTNWTPSVAPAVLTTASQLVHTQCKAVTINKPLEIVDDFELIVQNASIYCQFPTLFYTSYIPLLYGGTNISTGGDDECPSLMATLALFPGSYQPSGHVNLSKSREFYAKYNSSYISSSTRATLWTLACVMNFILIADGTLVVRYL